MTILLYVVIVLMALAAWMIFRLPKRTISGTPTKVVPEKINEEALYDMLVRAGGCIDCDEKPKGFAEGPRGGMNVNVFCIHCGQGYNLAPDVGFAQKIHRDPRYIQRAAADAAR